MQFQLKSQKNDYTRALLTLQASLDRIIRDKEELSAQIVSLTSELSEFQMSKPPDLQLLIQTQLEISLVQIKSEMNNQFSASLRKLSEESARKAQMEFAPQINQLRAKHSSEISIVRDQLASQLNEVYCQSRLELIRLLRELREQFHAQTEDHLARIDHDHVRALEQFRARNERERARFDSDIARIQKSAEYEIAEIRNHYKHEIDRERTKMTRLIEDCRTDIIRTKRLADQQMQRIGESLEKNNVFQNRLIETQYDTEFEEQNQSIISQKSKEFEEQIESYRRELLIRADSMISEKEIGFSTKISELTNSNEFTKQEINRTNQILQKQQNMRKRHQLRRDRSNDELQTLKTMISQLKDALFQKTSSMTEPLPVPDTSHINELKRELKKISLARKNEELAHEQQIDSIQKEHEAVCRRTAEKVKLLMERKDQQTKQLHDQLRIVEQKIPTLTKALRE
jgi:hypothetical protein